MVSARRGWGTQRANPGALRRKVFVCLCPGDPAPSGPPLGLLRPSVEPLVRAGDQAPREPTLGPCGTAPLFACAQGIQQPVGHRWGPEAPCGKEWWARQGKEPPTKQGQN